MKELTPIFRTFELESYEEHTRFRNLLDEQGYIVSKKYGSNSRAYEIKKQDAKDTEGSLNSFLGEHTLRVIRGTELEKLANDFMVHCKENKTRGEQLVDDADIREIAGVDE